MHLVRATPLKPGVPASLSTSNSYTAATPIALDDSPFCLRIRLADPSPCRTSRAVSGDVHIFGPRESKPSLSPSSLDISHLSIRIYYESRTTFWEIRPADGQDRPGKAPIIQRIGRAQRQEVHRGVAAGVTRTSWPTDESFTLPFKGTLLGRPHATLPFSFTLPSRMDITESTHPNGLCSFMRCPPPSFRESDASVEWVIEATMSLGPDPTRGSIVSRFVFPVIPSGVDIGALRDEPFFGEDVGADSGSTDGTFVKTLNVHGRLIESELYIPSGGMVSRDSPEFIMRLSLKLLDTPTQVPILGIFRKNRPIVPRIARCCLHRSVSTRGGQETKSHKTNALTRQYDVNLSDADVGLRAVNELADLARNDITIPFDLQTDDTYSKDTDRQMVPLATLVPSFRTPNIQLEYILTVSIFFVGDTREYRLPQFPLQITPEDAILTDKLHNWSDSKLTL